MADYDPPRGATTGMPGILGETTHRGDAPLAQQSALEHELRSVAARGKRTKTLFHVGLVAVTALIAVRLALGPESMWAAALTLRVIFALTLIVGSLLLFARWRFLEDVPSGWLSFSMLSLGIYLQPGLYPSPAVPEPTSRMCLCDLLLMAAIILATRASRRSNSPTGGFNPILLGLTCGLALGGMRLLMAQHGPQVPESIVVTVVTTAFVITSLVAATTVIRNRWVPAPWRGHLVLPVIAGVASHHLVTDMYTPWTFPPTLGSALLLLASLKVLATTTALVQQAHQEQASRLAALAERVERAEAAVEEDAELLHEARATVAGMNSASQLLTSSADRLAEAQVGELQTMLWAEVRRLQELLSDKQSDQGSDDWFDIDDILRPLVASIRAQGVAIQFRPSGLHLWGDREIVTTAVHVLLCNTKRHAPGAQITLWAARRDEAVVLHVADDGPGLPPEMSPVIFTKGARGPGSPGQGLGLYSARKQLRAHGGDLSVVPSPRGARFAVTLPLGAACSE